MADHDRDSGELPFLSREWLKQADSIARLTRGLASVAEVPPEDQGRILDRVGEAMEAQGVVGPKNWRAALAAQCGWNKA